jgi:hypothetical protein
MTLVLVIIILIGALLFGVFLTSNLLETRLKARPQVIPTFEQDRAELLQKAKVFDVNRAALIVPTIGDAENLYANYNRKVLNRQATISVLEILLQDFKNGPEVIYESSSEMWPFKQLKDMKFISIKELTLPAEYDRFGIMIHVRSTYLKISLTELGQEFIDYYNIKLDKTPTYARRDS